MWTEYGDGNPPSAPEEKRGGHFGCSIFVGLLLLAAGTGIIILSGENSASRELYYKLQEVGLHSFKSITEFRELIRSIGGVLAVPGGLATLGSLCLLFRSNRQS